MIDAIPDCAAWVLDHCHGDPVAALGILAGAAGHIAADAAFPGLPNDLVAATAAQMGVGAAIATLDRCRAERLARGGRA
jgi:predicted nucleic acid-binding protein